MKRIDDRPMLVTLGVVCLAVILICGLMMEYGWFGYSAQTAVTPLTVIYETNDPTSSAHTLVNLNTASLAVLDSLPEIGPVIAQRILDYREASGGFTSVEELKNISGIGDQTFVAIEPYVTVE